MSLPVPPDYLAHVLKKQCRVGNIALSQHSVGDLLLPTGRLVACDPIACLDSAPFSVAFPKGAFPVVLSVAHISTDQRVAFATIRFREAPPTSWDVLTVGDGKADDVGYGVDSGVAGFIDHSAIPAVMTQMRRNEQEFYETMDAEMKKTEVLTWSWLNVGFGDGNLIAFSAGLGDGDYLTYVGFDAAGQLALAVTDFRLLSDEKNSAP